MGGDFGYLADMLHPVGRLLKETATGASSVSSINRLLSHCPAVLMCFATSGLQAPAGPGVWASLLAGGVLVRTAAAMSLHLLSRSIWYCRPHSGWQPPLSHVQGYLYQLALTSGLQRARAAPAVAMSYLRLVLG